MGLDAKAQPPQGAQSAIAKLTADYRAGNIDLETYKQARAKALAGDFEAVYGPDGNVIYQRGGGQQQPLREFEAKTAQFNRRLQDAGVRVDAAEEKLMAEGGPSLWNSTLDSMGDFGNLLVTDEYQAYMAAAREWIAPLLLL